MSGYQIADEPAPGPLAKFAVNPLFPFLSIMVGGLWLAWPWFAFNSIAVGSPTRRKEITLLVLGFVGVAVVAYLLLALWTGGNVSDAAVRYSALALPVAKLAVVYAVYVLQARTIEIYEYYGGQLQNGFIVILILLFLRPERLLADLPIFFVMVLG